MIAEKPWKTEAVVRLFLGLIATLCTAQLLGYFFIGKPDSSNSAQSDFLAMVLTAVFLHGAALVWVALLLRENQITWTSAFGLAPSNWPRAVLWGVVTVLFFLPIGFLLQSLVDSLLTHPATEAAVQALEESSTSIAKTVFMGVFAVLLAPLAEEVLFRGILYPTIKQSGWPRMALWGTSLLFGLVHWNVGTFVPLVLFSAALIWLYEKTETLWASIIAHSLFNLTSLIVVLASKNAS